jgi:hypothetical protein
MNSFLYKTSIYNQKLNPKEKEKENNLLHTRNISAINEKLPGSVMS